MRDKMGRGLRFFFFHLARNPVYLIAYSAAYFLPGFRQNVSFYSHDEFRTLLEKGKSFIRFGDGEIHIINFGSNHYQTYHPAIRNTYLKIINEYSADAPYVIGISESAMGKTNNELRSRKLLHCWLPMKVQYWLRFSKNIAYVDAHYFYHNNAFDRYLMPYLKDKHVIVVTKKETIDALKGRPQFAFAQLTYIESLDFNSFSIYDQLKRDIDRALEKSDDRKSVLLIAVGPTTKALAYEYALRGVQSIDVGVGLEVVYSDRSLDHGIVW